MAEWVKTAPWLGSPKPLRKGCEKSTNNTHPGYREMYPLDRMMEMTANQQRNNGWGCSLGVSAFHKDMLNP